MKRELKFRAWHKEEKRMIDSLPIPIANTPLHQDDFMIHATGVVIQNFKIVDCLEIMQYTGVKDEFGVEIFNGDIIQDNFYDSKPKYEVVFDKCSFYGVRNGEKTYLDSLVITCEKVGSIYENPELLRDDKENL